MPRRPGLLLALAAAALSALAASTAAPAQTWPEREQAAIRYVEKRAGVESFAFVDDRGRVRAYRGYRVVPSASMLKAILLVAYLRRQSVRARDLRKADRRLLGPMIKWSDNATATRVLDIVGATALYRLADRADFRHFRLRSPWGLTEITARDQARFFYRIDSFVPRRHRTYALTLLNRIVPSQRWGIPRARPQGWTIHFKGGWGSGTGWVTHQAALLRRGDDRLAVAVFTRFNPSHSYGTRTIRGVARRLLRTPLPLAP
ncbi:MAG TPA: serine hydrolase [Gaiellaceae bacterium]|nr:serine hydrolase [Gaiellaceae bacterium]